MATRSMKFAVGLFVVGGSIMAASIIIFLGATRLFQEGHYYVTYFDESVQGLLKDSPVKYRGVYVGRVDRIGVAPDGRLVEVVLKIESGQDLDENIVAQLKAVGITGTVFVELNRRAEGEPDLSPQIDFPAPYPVIASRPSEVKTILSNVSETLNEIRDLDLAGISQKLRETLDIFDKKIGSLDVEGISNDIKETLGNAKELLSPEKWDPILESLMKSAKNLEQAAENADMVVSNVNDISVAMKSLVAENREPIREAIFNLKRSIDNARALVQNANEFIVKTDTRVSTVYEQIWTASRNIEKATQELNRILDMITVQPSVIFFGQSPKPASKGK